MTPEKAEILALQALGWLAAEPERLERFLNLSGLDLDSLRQAAGTRPLNVAILDFLMGHEPDLLRFCEETDVDPSEPARARRALTPGEAEM